MNTFPSGNFISVSMDCSIKIFNLDFELINYFPNVYKPSILYVDVKDENHFVICSNYSIFPYIKVENEWKWNKVIYNAHSDFVISVIYYSKGLISASFDRTVKIWEENNDAYINIKTLSHSDKVIALLFLEDKNILVSSGYDGTKFWDINNNYTEIIYFQDTATTEMNELKRIDDDRIIVRGKSEMTHFKIISISQKKIIKDVSVEIPILSFLVSNKKGIILVGGRNGYIKVYRNDNYQLIQTISYIQSDMILGMIKLKNDLIVSFDSGGNIYIWSF
jgi:WD40 repeat protein